MKKLTFTILFSILFCTIAWAQSTWELERKADSLAQEQEYSLAAEVYQDIITMDGGSPTMFLNLSLSLSLAGEIDLAYTALDSALLYGYDDLEVIENNPNFKALSKAYPKFQELINREREFYNVEIIDNEWVLKALSERKGVTLDDSKWDWEWNWESVNRWEGNFDRYPKLNLKFTADSLYDFKDRSLTIINTKNNNFYLNNLKLKYLNIESKIETKNKSLSLNDLSNLSSVDTLNVFFLDNLEVQSITIQPIANLNILDIYNIYAAQFFLYGVSNADAIRISDLTAYEGDLGVLGSEYNPIKFIRVDNVEIGVPDIISTSEWYIYSDYMHLMNSIFYQGIDFFFSQIEELKFTNNQFKQGIAIDETNFDKSQNYMPYSQIEGGFGVRAVMENSIYGETYISTLIADKESFDKLIYINKRMHSVYRERGDIESANAIYIKLKDLMTEYTLYQYKETGDIEYLIKYQIEKLLKFYTRSGTSPERAILISIFILLGFSIIYLFFPSEWDNQRNKQVIQDYKLLTEKNDAGYLKPFIALSSNAFIVWLNAFSLSLNAFVTLGFGSIPIKGVGKYICIIQGFMGWFLLSIFTVTLINQILV
ncbi:MAG: hypothetical protein O2911_07335 [Bacteroidetes bacterium]|nr:hypothetical protein [Bacteroidota bacterium]